MPSRASLASAVDRIFGSQLARDEFEADAFLLTTRVIVHAHRE